MPVEVAGTGFTVLDRVYTDAPTPAEALGGSCGNVLLSLAMLQRSVAPLLVLGIDTVGDRLVGEFAEAGAATNLIFRRSDLASPILAQLFEGTSSRHLFSFRCPETNSEYPRYRPIGDAEVALAEPALRGCAVFYADRLSSSIVNAMETARGSGAVVFFEPSDLEDAELFSRALRTVTVLKLSAESFGQNLHDLEFDPCTIRIVTHGAAGLEVSQGARRHWCAAIPAWNVLDTCGSGDMVSVGVIDHMLSGKPRSYWDIEVILEGVLAGQRLATANCAFVGARGIFNVLGAEFARSVLDGRAGASVCQARAPSART
ncbi:PfkB family carbohydrate kinase [uncultured Methylobacterium sp.]|uniref:PfkB family carbohydrate kinase n=1 Tax=uncultured Methylobacterium sp. TaxID=157278 RepID=UPI0035C96751